MSETKTFIQWKGTDLCMDFYCPDCAHHSHFDGFFAYVIECPKCHALFEMPSDVPAKKIDAGTDHYWAEHPMQACPEDDDEIGPSAEGDQK